VRALSVRPTLRETGRSRRPSTSRARGSGPLPRRLRGSRRRAAQARAGRPGPPAKRAELAHRRPGAPGSKFRQAGLSQSRFRPSRHGLLGRATVSPAPRTPRRSAAGGPLRRQELSGAGVRPRRRLASWAAVMPLAIAEDRHRVGPAAATSATRRRGRVRSDRQPAEVAPARESRCAAALPALVLPLDPLSEATPPAKRNPQGENPSARELAWGGCCHPRTPGDAGNMAAHRRTVPCARPIQHGASGGFLILARQRARPRRLGLAARTRRTPISWRIGMRKVRAGRTPALGRPPR
jgi:hypothetical protein